MSLAPIRRLARPAALPCLALLALLTAALVPAEPAPASAAAAPAAAVAPAPAPAAAKPTRYAIDPVHSSVVFRVKHKDVAWFYGRFNGIRGTIEHDASAPENGSVSATVAAESVDTGVAKRDDHLRSADFFSAAEFPEIGFESKSVKSLGEDRLQVTGTFTMHGVSKELTIDIEKTGQSGKTIGFESTFTIQRGDYDVGVGQGGLGEDVRITISIEANERG